VQQSKSKNLYQASRPATRPAPSATTPSLETGVMWGWGFPRYEKRKSLSPN